MPPVLSETDLGQLITAAAGRPSVAARLESEPQEGQAGPSATASQQQEQQPRTSSAGTQHWAPPQTRLRPTRALSRLALSVINFNELSNHDSPEDSEEGFVPDQPFFIADAQDSGEMRERTTSENQLGSQSSLNDPKRHSSLIDPIRRIQDQSIYFKASPSAQSIASLVEHQARGAVSEFNTLMEQRNPNASFRIHRLQRALATPGAKPAYEHDYNDVSPVTRLALENIFVDLQRRLGFQADNVRCQLDNMLSLLDSRCSRMDTYQAVTSLHADYIAGENANYRRWYLVTFALLEFKEEDYASGHKKVLSFHQLPFAEQQQHLAKLWRRRMKRMTPLTRAREVALWLLIWGEAGNVRFMPECLCFIFKLCLDMLPVLKVSTSPTRASEAAPSDSFLVHTVMPLYTYYRDQSFEPMPSRAGSKLARRRCDHEDVINYDDINECFRDIHTLLKLELADGNKRLLLDFAPHQRYNLFNKIRFPSCVRKTYIEKRTPMHLLTNFTRYWTLHVVGFYYLTVYDATFLFQNWAAHADVVRWSILSLGCLLAIAISLMGYWFEFSYLPTDRRSVVRVVGRTGLLLGLAALISLPSIYILLQVSSPVTFGGQAVLTDLFLQPVAAAQVALSVTVTLALVLLPPAYVFSGVSRPVTTPADHRTQSLQVIMRHTTPEYVQQVFVDSLAPVAARDRVISVVIWLIILVCKFIGSYTYLIHPFAGCLQSAYAYVQLCEARVGDPVWGGDVLCRPVGYSCLGILVALELVFFFLDTFLWYLVITTLASVVLNMVDGISVYAPWREAFYKLPRRIFVKLVAADMSDVPVRAKQACAELWNAIILAMYKEHIVGPELLPRLMYKISSKEDESATFAVEPRFFLAQEDGSMKTRFLPEGSELERRLSYFAQSLCMDIPEPLASVAMPTFTVLVPHFGEKILLSLKECIASEPGASSSATLMEYLQSLYAYEWENFVRESQLMSNEPTNKSVKLIYLNQKADGCASPAGLAPVNTPADFDARRISSASNGSEKEAVLDKMMHFVGFKQANQHQTLRTRIWASLRSQTLYRTISGFMNYKRAIALLYRIENGEAITNGAVTENDLDEEADLLSSRKFRLLITMQRYQHFTATDLEAVEWLFEVFKDLQIAYIEEEAPKDGHQSTAYYSVLIDGYCAKNAQGARVPKYRIRLPGPPILGDGKSDNQNHAVIFSRGEVIQVIDANQDNYLEECLKVGNLLAEFDFDQANDPHSPYSPRYNGGRAPVAIVGTREHIFSERIGPLADSAAGKEFVFGTLVQRIMTRLGSRMHYGHPDFLNYIFVTSRGGLSKAQKGLHLNEDIFAGMTALQRGARIKHTEYIQCGKGRDLGFAAVMNFITKLGSGVAEQTLSRESFCLGTRLPFDRLMSFLCAHTGFYINAQLIIVGLRLLVFAMLLVAILAHHNALVCVTGETCVSFQYVYDWGNACVVLIGVSLGLSLLPLALQMLAEKGVLRAVQRCAMQVSSLTSLFETFALYVYASSLADTLSFGGAAYIATGRAVSTTRIPFALLYNRFSRQGVNFGLKLGLMTAFICLHGYQRFELFLWSVVLAFALSPFVFNPHAFRLREYAIDYRATMRWLYTGHDQWSATSWAALHSRERTKYTGVRGGSLRARPAVLLVQGVAANAAFTAVIAMLFAYYQGNSLHYLRNGLSVLAFAVAPMAVNLALSISLVLCSCLLGAVFKGRSHACYTSAIGYSLSTVSLLCNVGWHLWHDRFRMPLLLLRAAAYTSTHSAIAVFLYTLMPPEFDGAGLAHMAFWSGQWRGGRLRKRLPVYFAREILVKTIELSRFAVDIVCIHVLHLLLLPVCLVPFIDSAHTVMLMWVRPVTPGSHEKQTKAALTHPRTGACVTALKVVCSLLILAICVSILFPIATIGKVGLNMQ
ncbi:1,3-beta-D-glucan synthase [Sorochytrium milnesiophthora]